MHVCLYFQHPLINPGDIVHYAENMHFLHTRTFLIISLFCRGKKNKRWLSPSKSIPAMLCPPLLSRCLPLVVKSSRNMLLHTSQTPPPLLIYIHQQTRTVTTSACGGASLFFFFFSSDGLLNHAILCHTSSHLQPIHLSTLCSILRQEKKNIKTGYIQRHLTVL